MNITIRPALESDIPKLIEIARSTFIDTYAYANDPEDLESYLESNFTKNQISHEFSNPDSYFFVVESQQELIAYLKANTSTAQTEKQQEDAWEIERIYVSKAHQDQAIGKMLLKEVITQAKKANAPYIWLGVWKENEKAIKFYQKNNFEIFGEHEFIFGKQKQVDYMMKFTLTD